MDITFQEFKNYVDAQLGLHGYTGIRTGQMIMNYLNRVRPDKYLQITNTNIDCFYDDTKIKDTMKHLERHWYE